VLAVACRTILLPCGFRASSSTSGGEGCRPRGVTGAGDVLATVRVGIPTAIEVEVAVPTWSRVLRGIVVVAVPGSVSGAFSPAHPPDRAAQRQENHLATSPPLVDATASTHHLTVSFQSADPGN
jgi:hypothetical protein